MLHYAAVTLDAVGVRERAYAGMGAQALPPMAHPGLTKITHCPLVEEYIQSKHGQSTYWLDMAKQIKVNRDFQ